MKLKSRLLIISLFMVISLTKLHAQDLHGLTFGFSAGYSILKNRPDNYFLSPDSNALQTQPLSKGSFVISSVISIKLGKLKFDTHSEKLVSAKKPDSKYDALLSRTTLNAALDLVNVNSDNIAFNTRVNGGLGVGFYVTSYAQVAVFYDVQTIRQVNEYVLSNYLGRRIPKGTEYYNALDPTDNSLFYNKTFTGWSFKLIVSLGNKKPDNTQGDL